MVVVLGLVLGLTLGLGVPALIIAALGMGAASTHVYHNRSPRRRPRSRDEFDVRG